MTPAAGIIISGAEKRPGIVPLEAFRVMLPRGIRTFTIEYGGTINHPIESIGREQARGFSGTAGVISDEGVYLAGSSYWYPVIEGALVSFSLETMLPSGWDAVSQGDRTLHEKEKARTVTRWESPEPQDEIFLIAGRFIEYTRPADTALAMAFLREPDKGLADKYLDAADRYLGMYEKLIGPYPYNKFALVENFWETGFGMPSFTLLGPKIIRLPFIINTSYPHEILHNWWGNSVFPDYEKGNWSEGLTAYLSDHLIREQQGTAAEYRQTTLQKYADYVLEGRDLPLTDFLSRHSSPSEAVGYGKSLMFFHMLRRTLEDRAFISGLKDFYSTFKFRFASFDDLRLSFERASGGNLKDEFDQWITRKGAPELRVDNVKSRKKGKSFLLLMRIRQIQQGGIYHMRIPVAVTLEGSDKAFQAMVELKSRGREIALELPARPLRVDIDPEFDLFRRLDREEIPPAVSQALGAKKMLIVLPSSADKTLLAAYRELARAISASGPDEAEAALDSEVKALPRNRAVTILGWDNRFINTAIASVSQYDASFSPDSVRIGLTGVKKKNHAILLTARHPGNKDLALMFIATDDEQALPGLARKLPHYHKYSYLAFEGQEPENVVKGRWPVVNSPMTAFLPRADGTISKIEMGKLPPRKPLAELPETLSGNRMMDTIRFLTGKNLKGRGFGTEGLDRAAEYIASKFQEAGLTPAGDSEGSYFQSWTEKGGDPEQEVVMRNVVGVIPGRKREYAGQSIVMGAHYDHLGLGWPDVREGNKGKIHPGADDNASGVAALLELARALREKAAPDRSIVLVAFAGEEAGRKGSKHYVSNEKRHPAHKAVAMVNLDTIGRLARNKLLVLGGDTAKEWVHIIRGAGYVSGVEVEMVSEKIDASDQSSFEVAGVPAIQITTGPHPDYHRPSDTADKIDAEGLKKAASVAKEIVEYLANRPEPLTSSLMRAPEGTKVAGERKVSLGTIPDFAYSGRGVRLSGVMPGSPAESAGLKEGDIIIRISSAPLSGLKDLSEILKTLKPGDRVSITFQREGNEKIVETELKAK